VFSFTHFCDTGWNRRSPVQAQPCLASVGNKSWQLTPHFFLPHDPLASVTLFDHALIQANAF